MHHRFKCGYLFENFQSSNFESQCLTNIKHVINLCGCFICWAERQSYIYSQVVVGKCICTLDTPQAPSSC